jgi:hypothetical protein
MYNKIVNARKILGPDMLKYGRSLFKIDTREADFYEPIQTGEEEKIP